MAKQEKKQEREGETFANLSLFVPFFIGNLMLGCLDKRRISVSIFAIFFGGTNWIWIVLSKVLFSLSLFTLGAIFGAALSIWNFAFVLGNCSIFLPEVPSIQPHPRTHTLTRTWQQLCSIARVAIDFCLCLCAAVSLNGHLALSFGQPVNWSTGQTVRGFFPRVFPSAFPFCCADFMQN